MTRVGSTDPIWGDWDVDEIIYMFLSDVGVSLRDPELEQFSTVNSAKGGIS